MIVIKKATICKLLEHIHVPIILLCVKCFLLFFNLKKTGVFRLITFSLYLNIDISMKCPKKLLFGVSPPNSRFISHYQPIHLYVNMCLSSYCSQSVLSACMVCRTSIQWFSISGVKRCVVACKLIQRVFWY